MGSRPVLFGNILLKVSFHIVRSLPPGQAQAVTDPVDMGIHGYDRLVVDYRRHHVGCFPPHAGQGHQLFHGARHLAAEILAQLAAQGLQMTGLAVRIRD